MKVIQIQTYSYKLHLSVGDDYKKIVQYINKKLKKSNIKLLDDTVEELKKGTEDSNILAFFINLNINGYGLIWINSKHLESLNPVTISHETIHACIDVFEHIGSAVNKETEEPFCYLHDYIMDICLKEVDKRRDGNNNTSKKSIGVIPKLD